MRQVEQVVKQPVELLVIWGTISIVWRGDNEYDILWILDILRSNYIYNVILKTIRKEEN